MSRSYLEAGARFLRARLMPYAGGAIGMADGIDIQDNFTMSSHPRPSRLGWSALLLVLAASVIGMTAAGGTGGGAGSDADTGLQALVGAQLIDPSANGKTIDNAVVLIRDGKIERVGPASSVRPPADARVTRLTGKFLLPGLISAHVHISDIHGLAPRAYTEENTERQLGVFAR